VKLHLGVRHWDHVIPLAIGDINGPTVTRLDATPDLWSEPAYDGGETSFSRYVRARAAGDDRVVALPVFLMRGFRHRCIIVRKDSTAETAEDLKGARIGLTGWPDSGNTWTRAILGEAGVGIHDADWQVGPLTDAHPVVDRIGGVAVGNNVRHTSDGARLTDLLSSKQLDAVMTPFMPPGFHDQDSPFRTLYKDTRAEEREYFRRHGFVPGIHLLALRKEVLVAQPEIAQLLIDLFEQAKQLSFQRRNKLMDITPWHNEEVGITKQVFGPDWMPYGVSADRRMVAAFQQQLVAQELLAEPVPADDLFPYQIDPLEKTA
jgi:4,5-dihydroxyphthalate decarboxylase